MSVFIQPEHLPAIEDLAESDLSDTMSKRVRLLLLYEQGLKTPEIADKVGLSPGRVLYWRRRYLRDGLEVFGNALRESPDDGEEQNGKGSATSKKPKKTAESKKTGASKKSKRVALKKLTRRAQKAAKKKGGDEAPRRELTEGIEHAEKRRKRLKKRLKHLRKKKAARARRRIKKLDRRIKRARKALGNLSS